jgi:hypothetical protein
MQVCHMYTGEDGKSYFRDISLDGALDGVKGAQFLGSRPHVMSEFVNAPRRQLVIQLRGISEVHCSGGQSRVFRAGDLLLADDLQGEGHRLTEIEGPREYVVVHLDQSVPLSPPLAGRETKKGAGR